MIVLHQVRTLKVMIQNTPTQLPHTPQTIHVAPDASSSNNQTKTRQVSYKGGEDENVGCWLVRQDIAAEQVGFTSLSDLVFHALSQIKSTEILSPCWRALVLALLTLCDPGFIVLVSSETKPAKHGAYNLSFS